ncbi:MAG TPA: alpha/beta hydrolase [Bryobacteraceae bacterium]|jgi:hypothetical protein
MKRIILSILAGLVFLSLLAFGAIGWVGSERALRPAYRKYDWTLATYPDLRPEPFHVRTADNITLEGRFFPGDRKSLVILASGYGDTQDQMLSIGEFLHRAGYSVLTYNSRARAPSGGEYVTLGVWEQGDLLSVVDYAAGRNDVDSSRIGVLGISRIRAVVDDSGFSDAPSVVAASFEHFIHLPAFPFAPLTVAIAGYRAGVDVNSVRPMAVIGQISPRPLLIIHDTGDLVVPTDNSRRNFAAAREPKELWLVEAAGHARAHTVVKPEYEKRVTAFFNSAIR